MPTHTKMSYFLFSSTGKSYLKFAEKEQRKIRSDVIWEIKSVILIPQVLCKTEQNKRITEEENSIETSEYFI